MARSGRPGTEAYRALGDRRAVPDRRWISALTGAKKESIENWLAECDSAAAMEARIHELHRAGGRASYAQFRAPFELYAIVRANRPKLAIETGVSSGVSSAHLLLALRKNRRGRLISIDLPTPQAGAELARGESIVAIPPGRESGWVVPPALRRGWDLRIGPAQRLLPRALAEADSVDLFLHDDLHTPTHLAFELKTLEPRLRAGSVVLADNTSWTGQAFARFAQRHGLPVRRRRGSDLVGVRME